MRGASIHEPEFRRRVEGLLENARAYHDELNQAIAASLIPLEDMEAEALQAVSLSREMGEEPPQTQEEALLRQLLTWFKSDFFAWVRDVS